MAQRPFNYNRLVRETKRPRPSMTACGASTSGSGRSGLDGESAPSPYPQGIQDQTWMLKKRISASEKAFQTGIVVPPILA